MIAVLLGFVVGFTKFPCFIYLWDIISRGEHYLRKEWPLLNGLLPGKFNVINDPLVKKEKGIASFFAH